MKNPDAAIIIIGNEILSGKTLDTNTQTIALSLGKIGISLSEVRTIPDDKNYIIDTVRQVSQKYDYVFTTGGIGPTHDDITSESIAAAFDLKHVRNQKIYDILEKMYARRGEKMNPAREKMACFPENCQLIYNKATEIPGFAVKNVFCLAGIPLIMKSMLDAVIPMLKHGKVLKSKELKIFIGESSIAGDFANLQNKYRDVDMGSYPFKQDGQYGTTLVLRSQNNDSLNSAFSELQEIVKKSD